MPKRYIGEIKWTTGVNVKWRLSNHYITHTQGYTYKGYSIKNAPRNYFPPFPFLTERTSKPSVFTLP